MSSRFILPFADIGSGIKPSSGAELSFFELDGVTPRVTHSDQLSSPTPNANPVVANSTGVFPDIYITGVYKVDLNDRNGSQIFGGAIVEELVTLSSQSNSVLSRSTILEMQNDDTLGEVFAINTTERTTGNGGDALWDSVPSSSVTPDGKGILQSNVIATLAFVMRNIGEEKYTDTISSAKLLDLIPGQKVITKGYNSKEDGGRATYIVKTTTQAASDGDVIDGFGNHVMSNGFVLIIQNSGDMLSTKFGVVADKVNDDSDALISLDNYCHAQDISPKWQDDILITKDIRFRRSPKFLGSVTFSVAYNGSDIDTTVNVYFERRMTIKRVTFEFVNVFIATLDPDEQQLLTGSNIKMCNFRTCSLTIGQENQITTGYQLKKLQFSNGTSRTTTALKIVNCNNVTIDGMETQDYQKSIHVKPTYSLAADNLEIKNSSLSSASQQGIHLEGTSDKRICQVKISNTTITGSVRNETTLGFGAVVGEFVCGLVIDGLTASHTADVVSFQACLDVKINNSTLSASTSGRPCFRFVGCADIALRDNEFSTEDSNKYVGLVLGPTINSFVTANRYTMTNFSWSGGRVKGHTRAIKFDSVSEADIHGVDFDMSEAIESIGLIWSVSGTRVRAYNNQYRALAGANSPLNGDTLSVPPSSTLITKTIPSASVTAPVITESDATLNNSKSYVVEFTLGDVKQLRQLVEGVTKKALTTWLSDAGVSGTATLAWNSAAWNTTTGFVNDMIANGMPVDNFGIEDTGIRTRRTAVVIDLYNRLNVVNFGSFAAQSLPLGQAAKLLNQKAWQTAAFRPPLVVDGVNADFMIDEDGITTNDWFNQISGRMCMGQKSDGTYIILAVDGTSEVSYRGRRCFRARIGSSNR